MLEKGNNSNTRGKELMALLIYETDNYTVSFLHDK